MISSKSRYAVIGLLDIVQHTDSAPVRLSVIAERTSIPLKYLEQIFARLRRACLVKSVRGQAGGYLLNKSANKITVAETVMAVEESVSLTGCKPNSELSCFKTSTKCLTHYLWEETSNRMMDYLEGVTLQDVLDREIKITKAPRKVYYDMQRVQNREADAAKKELVI